jgi:hypothetical protein
VIYCNTDRLNIYILCPEPLKLWTKIFIKFFSKQNNSFNASSFHLFFQQNETNYFKTYINIMLFMYLLVYNIIIINWRKSVWSLLFFHTQYFYPWNLFFLKVLIKKRLLVVKLFWPIKNFRGSAAEKHCFKPFLRWDLRTDKISRLYVNFMLIMQTAQKFHFNRLSLFH